MDLGLFQNVRRPKPEQHLVIQNIVQGNDVFAELPTRFSKNLTFQAGCYADASVYSALTLVVVVLPLASA